MKCFDGIIWSSPKAAVLQWWVNASFTVQSINKGKPQKTQDLPWGLGLRSYRLSALTKWNPATAMPSHRARPMTVQQNARLFLAASGSRWVRWEMRGPLTHFPVWNSSLVFFPPAQREALPTAHRIWFNFGRCLYSNVSVLLLRWD